MPIIIAHRPKMNIDASSYGYGSDESAQSPMRNSIMYGRPAPAAAQQGPIMMASRYGYGNSQPTAPVSPLAALLSAAMSRQQRMDALASPMPASQESQPQRVILLITRPREDGPMSPRMQVIPRDEPRYVMCAIKYKINLKLNKPLVINPRQWLNMLHFLLHLPQSTITSTHLLLKPCHI